MTYVQFPFAVLSSLGTNLTTVKTTLSDSKRGAEDVDGLGGDGQDRIAGAIGDFRDTWKTSVHDLIDNVGNWGGLSSAIGDMVQQFDSQTAAAMSPRGEGSTGPGGPQ